MIESPISLLMLLLLQDSTNAIDQIISKDQSPAIWCDECKMAIWQSGNPIRGARYMKQMEFDTFDLCKGCYDGLSESDQLEFKAIEPVTCYQSGLVAELRCAAG